MLHNHIITVLKDNRKIEIFPNNIGIPKKSLGSLGHMRQSSIIKLLINFHLQIFLSLLKEDTNNIYSSIITSFNKFNLTLKNYAWFKALISNC